MILQCSTEFLYKKNELRCFCSIYVRPLNLLTIWTLYLHKVQAFKVLKLSHECKRIFRLLTTCLYKPVCIAQYSEGDMGVYGIAVLGFFSCGISVILILTCGIAVSSSSAVCGFSSFWLTVFGEIRLFTVFRYRLFALSFRYNTQNKTQ